MRIYSKKTFFLLLILCGSVGAAVVSLTTWTVNILLPIPKIRYYVQFTPSTSSLGKPMPDTRMNHTLIVRDDSTVVENLLAVYKGAEVWPDVSINISVSSDSGQTVRIVEGNLSWSGQMLMNQTKILNLKIDFASDGNYTIYSMAISDSLDPDGGYEGTGMRWYITVQGSKIVRVADNDGLPSHPTIVIEIP